MVIDKMIYFGSCTVRGIRCTHCVYQFGATIEKKLFAKGTHASLRARLIINKAGAGCVQQAAWCYYGEYIRRMEKHARNAS